MVKRGETYPLGDPLTLTERSSFGVSLPGSAIVAGEVGILVRAEWIGEKRPPLKGEWYLSGAIVTAYRAPNDLTTSHMIARLVKTRLHQVIEVIREITD